MQPQHILSCTILLALVCGLPVAAAAQDMTGSPASPAPSHEAAAQPDETAVPAPPAETADACPDNGTIPGEPRYCVSGRHLCVWKGEEQLGCVTFEHDIHTNLEDQTELDHRAEQIFPTGEASRVGFRAFTRF